MAKIDTITTMIASNGVTEPIKPMTFLTSRQTMITVNTVTATLPQSFGMPASCSSNAPAPASITTAMANMKNVIRTSTDMPRSEEHTSELQSLMRISYAVLCLKNNKSKDKRTSRQLIPTTMLRH